jgi:hypothetical protein
MRGLILLEAADFIEEFAQVGLLVHFLHSPVLLSRPGVRPSG